MGSLAPTRPYVRVLYAMYAGCAGFFTLSQWLHLLAP
jgi:hypothetical protein